MILPSPNQIVQEQWILHSENEIKQEQWNSKMTIKEMFEETTFAEMHKCYENDMTYKLD